MLRGTILGCGSSGGVPRVAAGWGACDPNEPRNRRRRCSMLVEKIGRDGVTSVLVDTSPDLREQLIDAKVMHLDGVLITHDHADHTHGMDDLRPLVIAMRRMLDLHADHRTRETLLARFGYIFHSPPGSEYPPLARLHELQAARMVELEGKGGTVAALPIAVEHGPGYEALGFRFEDSQSGALAYVSDVSLLPDVAKAQLRGLDVLVLDALRYTRHPTHFSLEESLAAIAELKPKRAVLTNLHTDLDYATLAARLPPHVVPAYDGMQITLG
jgi:phosphoribosyl 1,2-cyclic phosphate phosphodiesterase